MRIANSIHEESVDVSWMESSWFVGDEIWLLWPAWTHHNLLTEGFTTQIEKSFTMISLTEQIMDHEKKTKSNASLGRVRKVDICLIKIFPFSLSLFLKEDWMRSNFFLLTVSSLPPFIFPITYNGQWWSGRKEKTSFALFSLELRRQEQ